MSNFIWHFIMHVAAYPWYDWNESILVHDDVIKWKHFPRNWPFVRGIHRSPVNSPHKGPWRGALMFSLNCARINDWVNNGEAGDLRRNRVHYDVIVMSMDPCYEGNIMEWMNNDIYIYISLFCFLTSGSRWGRKYLITLAIRFHWILIACVKM